MAWIESHQEILNHPKTARLKRRLGVSLTTTVGHLHRFWWWALSYAEDGNLERVENEIIADAGGWDGDPDQFVEALIGAGWVNDDRTIHDWDHYTGRIRKQREDNRVRQQRWRDRNVTVTPPDRDKTARNALLTRESPLDNPATGPNRTVPDLTLPEIQQVESIGVFTPKTAAAPNQADLLRTLSDDARAVLDYHRECQGKRRPAKLNPVLAQSLEDAVADLGIERCREAIAYMASKAVPELPKALSAARTKRQSDEDAGVSVGPAAPHINGTAAKLTPATADDLAIWERARQIIAPTVNVANFEASIAPLTVAGRGIDGGLRLLANPLVVPHLATFRSRITLALEDAGDPKPLAVAFVARRSAQESHHAE